MKKLVFIALTLGLLAAGLQADEIITLRQGEPINSEAEPARMEPRLDTDIKPRRNYPMQPPVIPHDIRGYEVNLQVNKCMACHARRRTDDSQATMISVTHYMDRDGNFLAEVSPRRYFCTQCHVTQTSARTLVDNEFTDMDELLTNKSSQAQER